MRSNCLIYDIRGLVNFENSKSTYGTITLTILKDSSLWEFINANTPNVFYFAAQAVSELGYAEDPTVWEGDWYDDYTLDKVQLSQMQLRYCESYIGQPMNCIIYRQFEEAQINLKLDYEEASMDIETSLGGYEILAPVMKYRTTCQVRRFKDCRCGYTGEETSCDRTFDRCKELGNQANFRGFPQMYNELVIRV